MPPTDSTTFVGATRDDVRHLELDSRRAEILAIGSQLAYGRVGLNATLPVLHQHGLRCAAVPTTILSVLPHYPSTHRSDLPAQWITDTLNDLSASGALDTLRAICIGYVATSAQVHAIAHWIRSRAETIRHVPVILDPTLGDIELGFYNDPRLIEPIRALLTPLAQGLTPNLFELAHLTGNRVETLDTLSEIETAAGTLLTGSTQWVIVTGLRHQTRDDQGNGGTISELVITPAAATPLVHPLLAESPAGVGDTFTAELTAALIIRTPLTTAADQAATATVGYITKPARS